MRPNQALKQRGIELVCRPFCRFFKEDKDEAMACEGFNFILKLIHRIQSRLDPAGLANLRKEIPAVFEHDALLKEALCERCEFLIDGCDFRDPACNYEAEPCGGYLLLDTLLRKGLISADELRRLGDEGREDSTT